MWSLEDLTKLVEKEGGVVPDVKPAPSPKKKLVVVLKKKKPTPTSSFLGGLLGDLTRTNASLPSQKKQKKKNQLVIPPEHDPEATAVQALIHFRGVIEKQLEAFKLQSK